MNWYIVYSERAVDMCGNTEFDKLGIVQLDEDKDLVEHPKSNERGIFKTNNEHYLSLHYVKTKLLTREELDSSFQSTFRVFKP